MPIYLWKDIINDYEIEVVRSNFDKYQDPPKEEELPEEERGKERKWERRISPGIRLTNSQKGYW